MKKDISVYLHEANREYDLELYQYGIKIIKRYLQFVSLSLILTFILDNTLESIVFCIAFSFLRSYYGGIHFENENVCLTFSVLFTTLIPFLGSNVSIQILHILTVISVVVYLVARPIDNKNKRLCIEEKDYFKKIALLWLSFEIVISFILTVVNCELAKYIFLAIISQSLIILLDIFIRGEENEKTNY